jgi:hypothetical protein
MLDNAAQADENEPRWMLEHITRARLVPRILRTPRQQGADGKVTLRLGSKELTKGGRPPRQQGADGTAAMAALRMEQAWLPAIALIQQMPGHRLWPSSQHLPASARLLIAEELSDAASSAAMTERACFLTMVRAI